MSAYRSGTLAATLGPLLRDQMQEFSRLAIAVSGTDLPLRLGFGEDQAAAGEKKEDKMPTFREALKEKLLRFAESANNSTWLERLSIMVVFVNCVTLTFHRPCTERVSCDLLCIVWKVMDKVALFFFIFEMTVKLIHRGPRKYLEDRWHHLDVLIVILGLLEEVLRPFQFNLASIRAMRILRPLRSIEWIPSVRLLVALLWDTLPMLANVFLLSIFFFIVFGIMAVQLWSGVLRQRCYHPLNLTAFPPGFPGVDVMVKKPFYVQQIGEYLCSPESGVHRCSDIAPSRSHGQVCELSLESALDEWFFQQAKRLNDSLISNRNATILTRITTETTTTPPPVLSACINWNRAYNDCRGDANSPNPFEGAVSFDNVLMAWVTIFQVITLEGWSDVMYHLQDAYSFWVFLYFVPLILFGSYFLVNLCLACITIQLARSQYLYYTKNNTSQNKTPNQSMTAGDVATWTLSGVRAIFQKCFQKLADTCRCRICKPRRKNSSTITAILTLPQPPEIKQPKMSTVDSFLSDTTRRSLFPATRRSFSFATLHEKHRSLSNAQQRCFFSSSCYSFDTGTLMAHVRDPSMASFHSLDNNTDEKPSPPSPLPNENNDKTNTENDASDDVFMDVETGTRELMMTTDTMMPANDVQIIFHRRSCSNSSFETASRRTFLTRQDAFCGTNANIDENDDDDDGFQSCTADDGIEFIRSEPVPEMIDNIQKSAISTETIAIENITVAPGKVSPSTNKCLEWCLFAKGLRLVTGVRNWLTQLLKHPVADYFFMYCIFISTTILAMEHHDQPRVLSIIVDSVNILFTLVFALEFVSKLVCFGPSYYTSSVFNIIDAGIVFLTVADIFGGTALSVFRALRLVRLLKLLEFVPALRNTLASLLRVVDSAMTFLAFLFICMYVFALFGTFLLGGRLCETEFGEPCLCGQPPPGAIQCKCGRKNFDSFLSSMLSVFQIFTQESWNELLYESMNKVSPWIAVYYITLVMVGNFILLNLLIAILVSGFLERTMEQDPGNSGLVAMRTCVGEQSLGKTSALVASSFQFVDMALTASQNPQSRLHRRSISLNDFCDFEQRVHIGTLAQMNHRSSQCIVLPMILIKPPVSSTSAESTTRNSSWPSELFFSAVDVNSAVVSRRSSTFIRPLDAEIVEADNLSRQASILLAEDMALVQEMAQQSKPFRTIELCRQLVALIIRHVRAELFSRSTWACYCLSPQNKVRQAIRRAVEHHAFQLGIFVLIAVNCTAVAFENPNIVPQSTLRQTLDIANDIMTLLFAIEMILKMIAFGIVLNADAYLRSGWNVLDCILAIVCMIEMILSNALKVISAQVLSSLRILRMLRALRPLRIINSSRSLRLIVETILSSMSEIGTVVVICFFFFLVYAIFGVQQFHGCLGRCRGPNVTNVHTRIECLLAGNRWQNDFYNFDNVLVALQTLFVFATFDNWMAIMFSSVDCVGIDKQPQENFNPFRMIYFLSFIIFCGFFLLNIFVGVVVSNFQRNFDKMRASETPPQNSTSRSTSVRSKTLVMKNSIEIRPGLRRDRPSLRSMLRHPSRKLWSTPGANQSLPKSPSTAGFDASKGFLNPQVPSRGFSYWRNRFRFICTHPYFDLGSGVAILFNVILMSLEHYDMPPALEIFIEITSYVFTGLFTFEMVVRIGALGFRNYFTEWWNVFDFLVVVSSLASTVFEVMSRHQLPLNTTLVRVMRVAKFARVLKVLRVANTMHRIIDTVGRSLLQVGQLSLLIIIVFFIYAAVGVELFGRLNFDAYLHDRDCMPGQYKCHVLGEHANFSNMGMAMLTLFRMLTGDNWSGLMKDIIQLPCDHLPTCQPAPILSQYYEVRATAKSFGEFGEPLYCCVPSLLPAAYCISFVLVTTICLLNLVVAVIMGTLEDSYDSAAAAAAAASAAATTATN